MIEPPGRQIGEGIMSRSVQFVTDAEGDKTAVILPLEEYEEMLEDLHMGQVARESRDVLRRPFADVIDELRADGERAPLGDN
jgi:FMN phosphatase YigB (HAD superfamily)